MSYPLQTYEEYFCSRTVADLMREWDEQRDEWVECGQKENKIYRICLHPISIPRSLRTGTAFATPTVCRYGWTVS